MRRSNGNMPYWRPYYTGTQVYSTGLNWFRWAFLLWLWYKFLSFWIKRPTFPKSVNIEVSPNENTWWLIKIGSGHEVTEYRNMSNYSNSKLIRDWQTYPILNIKPKLTEYFIHFIIHSKTFWFLIIRYRFSLFNFLSNFRHRYKCEALFHHEGDTFWTRMRRDEDDILNLPSSVPWLTIAICF